MRIKLDENIGRLCSKILYQAGHDVTTVHEEKLAGASDRALIEVCRTERRCLVTLDLEFGNPLLFNPSDYHGIAVLRLPSRSTPKDLIDAILTLLGGLAKENIEGKLWIIQRGRIRAYEKN